MAVDGAGEGRARRVENMMQSWPGLALDWGGGNPMVKPEKKRDTQETQEQKRKKRGRTRRREGQGGKGGRGETRSGGVGEKREARRVGRARK